MVVILQFNYNSHFYINLWFNINCIDVIKLINKNKGIRNEQKEIYEKI